MKMVPHIKLMMTVLFIAGSRLFTGCEEQAIWPAGMPREIQTIGTAYESSWSVVCYGLINAAEGMAVRERGFCYGTNFNPEMKDNHISCVREPEISRVLLPCCWLLPNIISEHMQ